MKLQKFRWSRVYESSEEELIDFLRARKLTYDRWTAEASHEFEPQKFEADTTLWCAEGSLILHIGDTTVSVQPGDAVHIPANTSYELSAGMSGCVCYESLRPQLSI